MDFNLSNDDKDVLLFNARESIASQFEKREGNYRKGTDDLNKNCGAFVTLYNKENKLRGCIGRIISRDPLEKTVILMAPQAAFGDYRFHPLTPKDFPSTKIEISVLSPLFPCNNPEKIILGKHGLYLYYRGKSGVFLPQVPVEQGWDIEQYLNYLCTKAELPFGSYMAPGAELSTFTSIIFSEA